MIKALLIAWVLAALPAQDSLKDSCSIYNVYPDVETPCTKALRGYKPFYISHIGRHGSRYLSKPELYKEPLIALEKAASEGRLTPEGERLLSDMRVLAYDAAGREGTLVPRGAIEHRHIIDRMTRRYAGVFKRKDARSVRAISTESTRAMMSMTVAMEELRAANPSLSISYTSDPRTMKNLFSSEGRKKAGRTTQKIRKDMIRAGSPEGFMGRILKDPSSMRVWDGKILLEGIWECAAAAVMNDGLGIDLFQYLRREEIEGIWRERNRYVYCSYGPSKEFGSMVLGDMVPMMGQIVSHADSAIAGNGICADFRFGHDVQVIPVAALMGIEGCSTMTNKMEGLEKVFDSRRVSPMAMNIQMIFYRKKGAEVLVKVLFNEEEVSLEGIRSVEGPFYRWKDVRESILGRTAVVGRRPEGKDLRIAIVGDIQVPDEAALERAESSVFASLRSKKDIDVCFFLGDLFMENPSLLPRIKKDMDSLPFPAFAVPGNHDRDGVLGSPKTRNLSSWKRTFGYVDTTFVVSGVRMILINDVRTSSERPGKDYVGGLSKSQKEWLGGVLESSEAKADILFTHIPLGTCHGADSIGRVVASRDNLLLVNAHTHRTSRSTWKGCDEINPGAPYAITWAADPRSDLMNCGAPRGYEILTIYPDGDYFLRFESVVQDYPGRVSATLDGGVLYVNVFAGAPEGKVTVGGREFVNNKTLAPHVKAILAEKDRQLPAKDIKSTHIWTASGSYSPGEEVEVKYKDPHMSIAETVTIK